MLVAVKIVHEDAIDERLGTAPQMMELEAVQLAQLEHPHIVRYFEAFWHESDDDGRQCVIITELLSGGTYGDHVRKQPAEARSRGTDLQVGRLDRLGPRVHALAPLQHRDLKPGNMIFDTARAPQKLESKPLQPSPRRAGPLVS